MKDKAINVFWSICKIISNTFRVGIDKPAHFLLSMSYAVLISSIFGVICGFIATISLGIGKEYGDSRAINNYWSWGDIIADTLGALVGCLAIYVIIYIL